MTTIWANHRLTHSRLGLRVGKKHVIMVLLLLPLLPGNSSENTLTIVAGCKGHLEWLRGRHGKHQVLSDYQDFVNLMAGPMGAGSPSS